MQADEFDFLFKKLGDEGQDLVQQGDRETFEIGLVVDGQVHQFFEGVELVVVLLGLQARDQFFVVAHNNYNNTGELLLA